MPYASFNKVTRKDSSCLNIDRDVDHLVANANQIFIAIPPKAAGSSLKTFSQKCSKMKYPDNFINMGNQVHDFLTGSFELPKIIASHLYSPDPLVHLIETATRNTLIFFIYREETERKMSAIKHVLQADYFCGKGIGQQIPLLRNETTCIVQDEEALIDNVIEKGFAEIGTTTNVMLDCRVQQAIEDHGPNMIMINYKQVDRLQHILGKNFCPELLGVQVHANVAENKSIDVLVQLKNSQRIVTIDDWLHEKKEFFDWALKSSVSSCQSKTNAMQNHLLACKDQTSLLSEWIDEHKNT